MSPLDLAFDTLRKSIGVIPSESIDKKSQSQLNSERKRKMRQAKKEKEEGLPPLPGSGWARVKGFDDEVGTLSPELGEHVARRKKGPYKYYWNHPEDEDTPYEDDPTDIFEHVDGEWRPTKPEMQPAGHLHSPTGRRVVRVKQRNKETAKVARKLQQQQGKAARDREMQWLQAAKKEPQLALPPPQQPPFPPPKEAPPP